MPKIFQLLGGKTERFFKLAMITGQKQQHREVRQLL